MIVRAFSAICLTLAIIGIPVTGRSQQPGAGQVQQALQNPDIAAQIRARIKASGLTQDQIRAKLTAAGYPADLLDPFLSADSTQTGAPGQAALGALATIGIIDSVAQASQKPVLPAASSQSSGASGGTAPTGTMAATSPTAIHSSIFGVDIFRSSTSRFDPLTEGPVDANYKVGPRDVLALILTGGVELSYTLEVSPDGSITIPEVGQVYVANLTLDQIRDILYTRLGRAYSSVTRSPDARTKFSLSVARVRANQVFVIGEAAVPGSYEVSSAGTMLTALYAAGGPDDNGDMRAIELRRAGKLVGTLDLYDYLVRGDASNDFRLESGDIVFIRFHGTRVSIQGEVGRPATFEVRPGETLADVVRYAGGLSPTAARHRIQIRRILPPSQRTTSGSERIVLDIPPDQLVNDRVPAFPLEPGDQIEVFGVSDVVRDQVTVTGYVWSPGDLGLRPGMRISDALKATGGVRPEVYLGQLLVTRKRPDGTPLQLRTSLLDSTGRVKDDFTLADGDSIRVFSRSEFGEQRSVTVSGAVKKPGDVSYRVGMSLREAVLLSGGLAEGAYLKEAEIARLTMDSQGRVTARTFRVPLDSSYLFDRRAGEPYSGPPGVPVGTARAPDVVLQPYDRILILRQPDWEIGRSVVVTGQVAFPGTYTLTGRTERLLDVIRRAGGLTPEAYADGAVFARSSDSLGRINISLRRAMQDSASRDNILLVSGDSIFVPRYSPVVKVSGAVSSPSSVEYVPGAGLTYYIAAAGGPLPKGDVSHSYVVQSNGSREVYRNHWWILPDHIPVPSAGGEVVVPVKPDDKRPIAETLAPIAQAVTALVALLVVIRR